MTVAMLTLTNFFAFLSRFQKASIFKAYHQIYLTHLLNTRFSWLNLKCQHRLKVNGTQPDVVPLECRTQSCS